jgi:hypothetical protein
MRFTAPDVTCAETVPLVALAPDNVPDGSRTLSPSGVEIKQFGGMTYDCPFHLRLTDFVRLSLLVSDGGKVMSWPEILFGSKLAGIRTGAGLFPAMRGVLRGVIAAVLVLRLDARMEEEEGLGATSLTSGGAFLCIFCGTWGARFMVGMVGVGFLAAFSAIKVFSEAKHV